MRLRLLGPVRFWAGDQDLLRDCRPTQRLLIALLGLRANQVASIVHLADRLWGPAQPATAETLIRAYISRLRTTWRRSGHGECADRVVTTGGGYLLRLGREELDLLEFEHLAGSAEQRLAAGESGAAAGGLRRALDLWTGPALSGLPLSAAGSAEASLLDERRLAAHALRIEADLRCGRHTQVIGELRALVVEHPLHERLWASLMTALYHSGQPAAALAVYAEARGHLVEQLGLEPGHELQRLHQAMIAGVPARELAGGGDKEVAVPGLVPAELPPDLPTFTGREQEVRWLCDQLAASPPLVAIDGVAGVGKSALAIHVAHRVASRFPDGQLYVDLCGATAGPAPRTPLDVLRRFLRSFGLPGTAVPADTDEASARLRSLLVHRRVLILLDNADSVPQIRPLLPAGTGCLVLVTSRSALTTLDGAMRLPLDVLSEARAIRLLERVAGTERVAAEPSAAATVVRLCGGLPLALRIAAARLAARPGWPVAEFAALLGDERRRLDELELTDLGVRTALERSYKAAPPPVARAFRLLGVFPGDDVAAPAMAALLGGGERQARDVLESLVDARLADLSHTGRYRLHGLLRLYARERVATEEPERGRRAATSRVLRYYLDALSAARPWLRPGELAPAGGGTAGAGPEFTSLDAALSWLDAERANLIPAIRLVEAHPETLGRAASDAIPTLRAYLDLRGLCQELDCLSRWLLALARKHGHPVASLAHHTLGVSFVRAIPAARPGHRGRAGRPAGHDGGGQHPRRHLPESGTTR